MTIEEFKKIVWSHYQKDHRSMPWRVNTDPYWIVVSEIMLQQTQAERVIPKFNAFIDVFPSVQILADSKLSDVLLLWSGLGYNRRAKFLHELAKQIVADHNGEVPQATKDLIALPGIGPNTAGAIQAYAFNLPVIYIETNIRAVFLYHFFPDESQVDDKLLFPLIERALDQANPREWYWALMDYGSFLKRTIPNPSRASKHHVKQSKFEGSKRQLRGNVLKLLLERPHDISEMITMLNDERTMGVIDDLQSEGLVSLSGKNLSLSE